MKSMDDCNVFVTNSARYNSTSSDAVLAGRNKLEAELNHSGRKLLIPLVYIDITKGDHVAALLLSQVFYWGRYTKDKERWFYKTAEEWYSELRLSYKQVKRASEYLEKLGFLETKRKRIKRPGGGVSPLVHYRLNDEAVYVAVHEWDEAQTSFSEVAQREVSETAQTSFSIETAQTSFSEVAQREVSETSFREVSSYISLDDITQKDVALDDITQKDSPLTPQGEPELCVVVSDPPNAVRKEEPTQQPTVEPISPKVSSAFLSSEKIVPVKSTAPARWRDTGKLGKRGFPVVEGIGRSLELYPWMECDGSNARGYRYKPEFETYVAKFLVKQKYYAEMKPGEFITAVRDWLGKALMDDSRFDQVMVRWEAFQQPMGSESNESVGKLWKQYEWEAGASEREEYQKQLAQRMAEEAARNPKPPRKKLSIKDVM